MDITDLKRQLGGIPFEARWPGLADSIRKGREAKRRALSGPTIADLHQARMDQIVANAQRQIKLIQEKTKL